MINGIFSKGFNELSKYFDAIYCTNSYQDMRLIKDKLIEDQVDLNWDKESDDEIKIIDLVKQLDVF